MRDKLITDYSSLIALREELFIEIMNTY